MEKFYTPEQVAEMLQINSQTVLVYIRDGKLKAVELGKGYRISQSSFDQFVQSSSAVKTAHDYLLQETSGKTYKSFRKTSLKLAVPLEASIPNRSLDQFLSKSLIRNNEGYRAFPIPSFSILSEMTQHLSDGILLEKEIAVVGRQFYFAFASTRGEVLSAESMWEDDDERYKNTIDFFTCLKIMYYGLAFIPRYYSQIPFDGEIVYEFSIDKPEGRRLSMDAQGSFLTEGQIATTRTPLIVQRKISALIMTQDIPGIMLDMVKDFLWYFKCDMSDEVINNHIAEIAKHVVS